jgi:hypothetical protein
MEKRIQESCREHRKIMGRYIGNAGMRDRKATISQHSRLFLLVANGEKAQRIYITRCKRYIDKHPV